MAPWPRPLLALAAACALLFPWAAPPAAACPAALFAIELSPSLKGPRKGVRIFAKDPRTKAFRAVPLQVDPVDDDGHLVFFKDDHYLAKDLDKNDFMTFRVEDFGARMAPGDKLPCRGDLLFELIDRASDRVAYLTNCGFKGAPVEYPHLVAFDKQGHRLESSIYRYRFNPDNYMQFNTIDFQSPRLGWDLIASDSRLEIRADVRNFFNMNFDSNQIESQLEASRLGPIANLARVSFFLRILVFKIKMSLATDVAFFSDSGHIPMMVNIPVNAHDYLNPGSGILYSWVLSPAAQAGGKWIEMPRLDVPTVKKGFKELAKTGLQSCDKSLCRYKVSVDVGDKRLSMDLDIERRLVERGFFPHFVDDVAAYKEQMGWKLDVPKGQQRVGMYFEVSGLPKGGHPWNFWLRLGGQSDGPKECPAPIRVARVHGS